MQIISLLTILALAGFLAKKEVSPYARIIIGSVFGLVFFAVWPFVYFYNEIHNLSDLRLLFSYLIISVIAVVLSVILVKIKKYEFIVVAASLIVFILAVIISQTEGKKIKNNVAIYTNYYDRSMSEFEAIANQEGEEGERFQYAAENYTLSLDKSWIKKTDKGPMFDYFYLIIDGARIAELRPKCSGEMANVLPDSIMSMQVFFEVQGVSTNTRCYQINNNNYACRMDVLNKEDKITRVRWLSINTIFNTEVELDFVVFNEYPLLLNEIQQVINSISFKKSRDDLSCLSLIEWM